MFWEFLSKFLIYALGGYLLEVFFTGLHSLIIDKNIRCVCTTYLPMGLIYGVGGLCLEGLHIVLNKWLFIPIAVLAIYGLEFGSGWLFLKIFKRKLWDYGNSRFGVLGLIRIDYLPLWVAVAIGFEAICDLLTKIIRFAILSV